jgi:LysR family transcriptional regulator (chromosome initiation inhibitor)
MGLDAIRLATFAAVVSEGSFEAAARRLHITPSAVSQRIKALEQVVGQVLVCRAKPCRATEAGQPLLRLAGQISLLEQEALAAARGPLPGESRPTRVSVVVNADSLATWFPEAMAQASQRMQVVFDLRDDDQDHTAQLLRDGSVMAAVTAQRGAVQGCRVSRLGVMRYLPLASPGLMRRHFPRGVTPEALATVPMLVFDRKDRLQHRFLRTLTGVPVEPPVHYLPSVGGFVAAIRLGLGWGMVPEQQVTDLSEASGLVSLVDGGHLDVPLYWQRWRIDSVVLATLTDTVLAAATRVLRSSVTSLSDSVQTTWSDVSGRPVTGVSPPARAEVR